MQHLDMQKPPHSVSGRLKFFLAGLLKRGTWYVAGGDELICAVDPGRFSDFRVAPAVSSYEEARCVVKDDCRLDNAACEAV